MVQIGTVLNVVDNSGAKKAYCIQINNTSENMGISKFLNYGSNRYSFKCY